MIKIIGDKHWLSLTLCDDKVASQIPSASAAAFAGETMDIGKVDVVDLSFFFNEGLDDEIKIHKGIECS